MVKLRKHHRIAKPGNVGSHLGSVSNLLVYLLWALVYSFVARHSCTGAVFLISVFSPPASVSK